MTARQPHPIICTVDVVLLRLHQHSLQVMLQPRDRDPFKDEPALPGGYIHAQTDADAQAAAERVLLSKAGLNSPYLEQLATFSGPTRDPRGWSVSIAYFALVAPQNLSGATAGRPDQNQWLHIDQLPGLPFDHAHIIQVALDRLRTKSHYSSLPAHLLGDSFTLPQLQAVYEAVLGETINKVSFRRKVDELAMLEPIAGAMESGRANRPAQLYRLRKAFRRQLSLLERGLAGRG